ncbi:MAG: sensor histidine kinase [Curvibacter sp.]|nr:MAG: sensor histidine kinase [Curvibacter sp.]
MASGLRNRLLVLLLGPLFVLGLVNVWVDYRSADSAAVQHDRQLLRYVPLLADSVLAPGVQAGDPPVLLLAPPVEDFLKGRSGLAGYSVNDLEGRLLHGDLWLPAITVATGEPEFHSTEYEGVTYRIVSQRVHTRAGDLIVQLADGSDPRQQWLSALLRVLLPNGVLMVAAALAVSWAVGRALRPLTELTEAVSKRSPQDLSAIDVEASPAEVRPLVESLNRLFDLVNAQSASQRRFIADAAHQLRTPLAGLQAQVEAWAQVLQTRQRQQLGVSGSAPTSISLNAEQLDKLRQATRRTSQLANQLLALSRADARAMEAQPMQRVDLLALCESLLEAHLDAATARGIDLGLAAQVAHATGHEWLLRELLANLIDNAIRYTPRGGSVTIRCGQLEVGEAMLPYLAVEDDGPGIAPAERNRVTERFYRVPGTVGEGSGLGLAIAHEIARVHHSCLELMSGPGQCGLLVRLVLPAQTA